MGKSFRSNKSKSSSKSKGDSAEDIAAREEKARIIAELAAIAAARPADDGLVNGIHPSRMQRLDHAAATTANGSTVEPSRKRKAYQAPPQSHGPKKQRTLAEIKKLKGPKAMEKEAEKRKKQALAKIEATHNPEIKADADSDTTKSAPSIVKPDAIKADHKTKTSEEKAARKAEKLARKQQAKSLSSEAAGGLVSVKEVILDTLPSTVIESEEKETVKVSKPKRTAEEKAARKLKKEQKKTLKASNKSMEVEKHVSGGTEDDRKPIATVVTGNDWSSAANSLGSKGSKFLKLMGGAKEGNQLSKSLGSSRPDQTKEAIRAQKELEKQYKDGLNRKGQGRAKMGI